MFCFDDEGRHSSRVVPSEFDYENIMIISEHS